MIRKSVAFSLLLVLAAWGTPLALAMEADTHPAEQDWIYRFQVGDTVWDVSRALLKDWRAWAQLADYNSIQNDRAIPPGTLLRIPPDMISQEPARIVVQHTTGVVMRRPAGREPLVPLHAGETLAPGDAVVTDRSATAQLQFDGGTRILVLGNSELSIRIASRLSNNQELVNIRLLLREGEVEIDAHRIKAAGTYFLIETPSAHATTRGTHYRVRAHPEVTLAEVTQGQVRVANAMGHAVVRQGFGLRVAADKAPAVPQRLLSAPAPGTLPDMVRSLPHALDWPVLAGAVGYRIQLAEDAEFAALVMDATMDEPVVALPAGLDDGAYHLRIAGIDADALQGLWLRHDIEVDTRPQFPPPQAPVWSILGAEEGEMVLRWSEVEHGVTYQYQLARTAAFRRVLMDRELADTEALLPLPRSGRYFARVRSVDRFGRAGAWSDVEQLVIPYEPSLKDFLTAVLTSVLLL